MKGNLVKEDGVGWACYTPGRDDRCIQVFCRRKLKERDHSEDDIRMDIKG
jgi:hypothetical protein